MLFRWFCHFDDDVYVNTPNLVEALSAAGNALTKAMYVGKRPAVFPKGYNVNTSLDASGKKVSLIFARYKVISSHFCLSAP
jgi:hypothetical protein